MEELSPSIEERIKRIEIIVRDHGMHEPPCPRRAAQKHNAMGGTYMTPMPCDCWLKEGD